MDDLNMTYTPEHLQALREAIAVGLASGPGIPEEEVFDRLEAKYRAMAEKAV